jgi:glucosamine kinase
VTERFNHDTAQAIAWMDQATPRDYGTFAPLVMDYAEADDAIARSIVEDAAAHIERFIETIFERGATRCTLVGGLAPA